LNPSASSGRAKKAPKKNRPLQHNCLKLLAQATRISTPHPDNCRVLLLSEFVKQEILAYAFAHNFLTAIMLRRVVPAAIEKAFVFKLHSPQLLILKNDLDNIGFARYEFRQQT